MGENKKSKSERRKEIKQLRQIEFDRKKVILLNKFEVSKTIPPPRKKSISYNSQLMVLDRSCEDREGKWSWGASRNWTKDYWLKDFGPYLEGYTGKKWCEIKEEKWGTQGKPRNTHYPVDVICREAQKRLEKLQLDDFEMIFRFRKDALTRVYGFVVHPSFQLVWLDLKHKIYPVDIQQRGKRKKR